MNIGPAKTARSGYRPSAAGDLLGRVREKLEKFFLAGEARLQHRSTMRSLRAAGERPQSLLFLCLGNICRSPISAMVARREMPRLHIDSAGFLDSGRHSPAHVQAAALQIGIDLSQWSSQRATRDLVAQADLIVLLDTYNFRDLRSHFPDAIGKAVMLGMFLDPSSVSIADPYTANPQETAAIVQQIDKAVAGLAGMIATLGQAQREITTEPESISKVAITK